jgi:hypothetical protein
MSDEDKVVCVFTANGETEAQLIRSFLEANGIPCIFHGEAIRLINGLTLDGLGKVEIRVRKVDKEKACELLAAADKGELRLDQDETE